MWFFTADEHYYHEKIIEYANRPFRNLDQMHAVLIDQFNLLVGKTDVTVHAGDFCFGSKKEAQEVIRQLNGSHVFLKGSHDRWLPQSAKYIWEKSIEGQQIIVCHYCMRTWKASHYNSWHLYGHSHGGLKSIGKSHDIGVDGNYFFPYSFNAVKALMRTKEDNFNLVSSLSQSEREKKGEDDAMLL